MMNIVLLFMHWSLRRKVAFPLGAPSLDPPTPSKPEKLRHHLFEHYWAQMVLATQSMVLTLQARLSVKPVLFLAMNDRYSMDHLH